jgi:FkbM family methyltransferase
VKAYNHLEELSKKFEQIIPIQKAISKENGVTSMFIDNNNSAVNCVTKYGEIFNNTSNETQVETININSLISTIEEKINFLKVDCEGSEYDLFQTITSPNLQKIERCVIETHGEEIDNFVYKTLVENHFEVKKYKNILYAINKNW